MMCLDGVVHFMSLSKHGARCTTRWVENTAKTRDLVTCPKCLAMVRKVKHPGRAIRRVVIGTGYLWDDADFVEKP